MAKARMIQKVNEHHGLNRKQRKRVLNEIDILFEIEKRRRVQCATQQYQKEWLEHKIMMTERILDEHKRIEDTLRKLNVLKARANHLIAVQAQERLLKRIEIIERIMRMKAQYNRPKKSTKYTEELLKIKHKQKISEMHEQAMLNMIAKRAVNRAAFIKMAHKKFPEMAEELIDFYDQQIFQKGTGG
jgi:hypothetical protein